MTLSLRLRSLIKTLFLGPTQEHWNKKSSKKQPSVLHVAVSAYIKHANLFWPISCSITLSNLSKLLAYMALTTSLPFNYQWIWELYLFIFFFFPSNHISAILFLLSVLLCDVDGCHTDTCLRNSTLTHTRQAKEGWTVPSPCNGLFDLQVLTPPPLYAHCVFIPALSTTKQFVF